MVRSAPGSAPALSGARLEPSGTALLPSFETHAKARGSSATTAKPLRGDEVGILIHESEDTIASKRSKIASWYLFMIRFRLLLCDHGFFHALNWNKPASATFSMHDKCMEL